MPLVKQQVNSAFPASSSGRYYIGQGLAPVSQSPTQNTILYVACFVKKDVNNPILAVDQSGAVATTTQVGIYDGSNGIVNAPLLFSTTLTTSASAAIYTANTTVFLKRGFYILAGVATSATPTTFRAMSISGASFEAFGRETSITTLDANHQYTETGQSSLPSSIGTITRTSVAGPGVYVFIRY